MNTNDDLRGAGDDAACWTSSGRRHDGSDEGKTWPTDSSSSDLQYLSDDESVSTLVLRRPAATAKPKASSRRTRRDRELPYTRSNDRWRLRPKDELEYLRKKVVELEALAAALRISDSEPQLTNTCDGSSNDAVAAKSGSSSLETAMEENQRLRGMLCSRMRVARALESAIDHHMKSIAQRVPWPATIRGQPIADLSDELIFALLDEGISNQFAATDEAMKASGIAGVNRQMVTKLKLHESASGLSFHNAEVRILPYDVADVTRALCDCLGHGVALKSCRKLARRNNGLYAVVVNSMQTSNDRSIDVKARHTQRCFVEKDRTVLTWSSCMEYGGPHFLRLHKKIWTCLDPITTNGEVTGTTLRCVVQMTPTEAQLSLEEETRIKEMADIIAAVHQHGANMVYQSMLDQLTMCSELGGR